MSEVIAFCERHAPVRSMLDLLRNCGQITPVTEMFALQVLEELVANDPDKVLELQQIRVRINPVDTKARFRITIKEREAKMLEAAKKSQELLDKIERVQEELRQLKMAKPPQEEHESQAFEDDFEHTSKYSKLSGKPQMVLDEEETQVFGDGCETQPKADVSQDAALMNIMPK